MRTFGIIGYPLSHSFSQKYFTEKFEREKLSDCKFLTFPIEDMSNRDFYSLLEENPDLCGLSVTIPYKEKIIALLDEVDPIALFEVHAVNCIRVRHDKDFKGNKVNWSPLAFTEGDNTDTAGFENSLLPLLKPQHTKALILGSGGAAKAVSYVLRKLNIEHLIVTRNIIDLKDTRRKFDLLSRIKYQDVDRQIIDSHPLIINTTPLGMFPNINACPDIPYEFITPKHLLYDLTYNPEESLFLKKGKEKGAQIKNGLEMLELQAEKAWEIWNDTPNP